MKWEGPTHSAAHNSGQWGQQPWWLPFPASRHFREATEPQATVGSHTVLLQGFEERIPILWEGRLGLPSLPPPSWLPPRLVPEKPSCTFSQAASGGRGWGGAVQPFL